MVALIVRDHLFVANAGDSRAVLCRGGKAVPMSGADGQGMGVGAALPKAKYAAGVVRCMHCSHACY